MATLTIKNLSFRNIGPINLSVAQDEFVFISGQSGAGKTLLLRAICDLDPHQGEIHLNDQEHNSVAPHEWRRWVGLLSAESQWWFDEVRPHFPQEIDAAQFSQLGFEPDVLDWTINRLSSGEKQRLALLRLLNHTPQALLLDEASANLDSENTEKLETLIQQYQQKHHAPVLWISHDPQQIQRMAKRHFKIENGQLREQTL